MNWLLLVILIVIILSAAAGYRRGFVRTVLSMVFLILVMVVSGWISPYISDALKEHTQITETIRTSRLFQSRFKAAAFPEPGRIPSAQRHGIRP